MMCFKSEFKITKKVSHVNQNTSMIIPDIEGLIGNNPVNLLDTTKNIIKFQK